MFNDQYGLTKAVLEGKKTQTRRLALNTEDTQVFNLYPEDESIRKYVKDRYSRYSIGETLAVAESYQMLWETEPDANIITEASQVKAYIAKHYPGYTVEQINRCAGWKNKMFVKAEFMPHQIRITNIRLERLQDISDEDCLAEGIRRWEDEEEYKTSERVRNSVDEMIAAGYDAYAIPGHWACFTSPKDAYADLIDKVSGKGTWEKNPWVFVYDFKLAK